jgi:hypothetical protein
MKPDLCIHNHDFCKATAVLLNKYSTAMLFTYPCIYKVVCNYTCLSVLFDFMHILLKMKSSFFLLAAYLLHLKFNCYCINKCMSIQHLCFFPELDIYQRSLTPVHGEVYPIQHYVIKFVSGLQ